MQVTTILDKNWADGCVQLHYISGHSGCSGRSRVKTSYARFIHICPAAVDKI